MGRIEDIYALLGTDPGAGRTPVLLPINSGEKGPKWSGWREMTWQATQTEEYARRLNEAGNIGVLLGAPSGGLCAIDVDSDAELEAFLKLNPGLNDSLTTKGKRGVQIWVWCESDPQLESKGWPSWPKLAPMKYPDRKEPDPRGEGDIVAQFGEWRADGGQSVVSGVHPTGARYRVVVNRPPLSILFRDICWPDGLETPWFSDFWSRLIERYGPPWMMNNSGRITGMCELFWVGRFTLEHEVLFEADEERFYQYAHGCGVWERRSDEEVQVQFSYDILRAAKGKGEPTLCGNAFRGHGKLSALTTTLKGEASRRGVFRQDPGVVHLKNGMLDLRQDPPVLRGFNARFFSRNPIPVDFRQDAECPRFMDDLLHPSLDQEDIDLLQRWAGGLLLGHNLIQRFMILTGTAGGGKSTILKIFQSIIGRHNCAQLRTEQLHERFELFAYVGKTFLTGVDVPGNFLMHKGAYVIKGLTGGDIMQAEKKGGDFYAIEGNFNIGITCNSRLKVRLDADADAWRRRLLIINFEMPRPDRPIVQFAEKLLEEESSGILNWMITGAIQVMREVKSGDGFKVSDGQRLRIDSLLSESDSIRWFVKHCVEEAPGCSVTTEEMAEAYLAYCDEMGWEALPQGTVQKVMPDRMLEIHRVSKSNSVKRGETSKKGYHGVRLVERTGGVA